MASPASNDRNSFSSYEPKPGNVIFPQSGATSSSTSFPSSSSISILYGLHLAESQILFPPSPLASSSSRLLAHQNNTTKTAVNGRQGRRFLPMMCGGHTRAQSHSPVHME